VHRLLAEQREDPVADVAAPGASSAARAAGAEAAPAEAPAAAPALVLDVVVVMEMGTHVVMSFGGYLDVSSPIAIYRNSSYAKVKHLPWRVVQR
jgi:hypothetical protein